MFDQLTGMRVFVLAVQQGSISAAAERLELSPTMAGRHLTQLEEYLGVKLFHRSTRRLSITEPGVNYLPACERILADISEANRMVSAQQHQAQGILRMNVPLSFGIKYLAPLMPLFSQTYPQVQVELGLTDQAIDLLAGHWDMGIRVGSLANSPSLQARKLADCQLHVCAAPAYLAQHGTPQTVADLSQHNCLQYSLSEPNRWAFGTHQQTVVEVSGNLTANNGDALVIAAIGGQGIIYKPDFLVRDALADGRLVNLTLDQPVLPQEGIYAFYPKQRYLPLKVRVMIDFLTEQLQQALA